MTKKTGKVCGLAVLDKSQHDVMLISVDGTVIRMEATGISTMGRSTSGVKLMSLDEDTAIAAIAKIPHDETPEDEEVTE